MVSFPPVSPPRPYTLHSPHPYAPHAQPISFFSILSPARYWVSSTNHLAPRYIVSSIPPLPRPSSVQIFSSTPIHKFVKTQHKAIQHIYQDQNNQVLLPNTMWFHHITMHYWTLLYITVHYNALLNITVHYCTLQRITENYCTLQHITENYCTLMYIKMQYWTLLYITVHYIQSLFIRVSILSP